MKTITGCEKSRSTVEGETSNHFNHFFNRFDCIANVSPNHPAPLPIYSTPIPSSQRMDIPSNPWGP